MNSPMLRPTLPAEPPNLWVLPAKQQRSMQTRDRLLAAGRDLMNQERFDAISVAALARQAGCSVGSFYSRFQDKEAFYQAVLDSVDALLLLRIHSEVNADTVSRLSASATVEACVDALLGLFRDHAGLLRTVQHKAADNPLATVPLRRLGKSLNAYMVNLIAARHGETDNPAFRHNVAVGLQIAIAIGLNSALNAPPLLNAANSDYTFWVKEVVLHALTVRHAPLNAPAPSHALRAA